MLLERLGWTYVPRNELAAERGDEREVLLKGRLQRALLRLNEWMTEEQADRAVFALEHLDATGMARNQAVHEYFTYGMPLSVDSAGGRRTRIARFFDFDHPEGGLNEFVVTTQFRVRRGNERSGRGGRRAHGHPRPRALRQRHSAGCDGGEVAVAHGGLEVEGGAAAAALPGGGAGVARLGRARALPLQPAVRGPLRRWRGLLGHRRAGERLLRVEIRPALLGGGGPPALRRRAAGPGAADHRAAFAVNAAGHPARLRGLRAGAGASGEEAAPLPAAPGRAGGARAPPIGPQAGGAGRRGLAHSGLRQVADDAVARDQAAPRAAPRQPAIIVVTDRTQLDKQIASTFERCGFPAPEQASSSRDLRRLLTTGSGRTVMTTIQKFEEALTTPTGELDTLDPSENIIVMVDEAHRTQYGTLGARMSRALPGATLIGFTGTPIDKGFKRSTMGRFGPLIDSYTIPQSVADGATVPIWYEARLPELAIDGPETLDMLFDALFGDQPDNVQTQIRPSLRQQGDGRRGGAAHRDGRTGHRRAFQDEGSPQRLQGAGRRPYSCSRAALRRASERFRPARLPDHHNGSQRRPEFQAARELDRDQTTNAFVDPQGEPEILVVVDMLLTGFDAPVEQALYLDRSLREHGLLQAIARVNRRFAHAWDDVDTEKEHGLVVDYHGVSRDLEQALSTFDWPDVRGAMTALDEDPAPVIESAAVHAESHFKGRDLNDTWACVGVFAPDASTEGDFKADLFERFNADYRELSRLMDRFLPDPRALAYVDRLAGLRRYAPTCGRSSSAKTPA